MYIMVEDIGTNRFSIFVYINILFHFYRYFILFSKIKSLLISILFYNVSKILKPSGGERETLLYRNSAKMGR